MRRSIQWTLQLWHAGLLAVVLIGFGTAVYFGVAQSRHQQFDAEMERAVLTLMGGFRPPKPPDTAPASAPAKEPVPHDPWEAPPPAFEVPPALAGRFAPELPEGDYYIIWDHGGQVIAASHAHRVAEVPYPGVRPTREMRLPAPAQMRQRGAYQEAYVNGPMWTRLLIGVPTRPLQLELRRLALRLVAIGVAVLGVGLVGGWVLSRRAVKPIRAITEVAREISASNLSRRIASGEVQSELGSLATVLNEMFARLEAAFAHQVRFTADASHELRTPLAVIHTHVQLALSRERSAEEYRKTLETCLRASGRMKDLVDSLLLLAGADAGRLTLKREHVDLRATVEGCVALVAPLAEPKGVSVATELQDVDVLGDASRLAQVTTNLLTNAIRYNRKGGQVRVTLAQEGPQAVLTIADTGMGIAAENQAHIFERFYRVDKARSREEGGSGLGLAICKTIVEGHGGTIAFRSVVGEGTTFEVRLGAGASAANITL